MTPQLWGMSDTEMEALLAHGNIPQVEDIGTGITKPSRLTIEDGNREEFAVFKYEDSHPGIESHKGYSARRSNDSDRYQYDVAAYKLDRLINLQMVPPTILREVNGEQGAVGAWIPNLINERD